MPVTITFLGHSGFLFSDGTHTLCVDPFLTGNRLAKHSPDDVKCDYIALTHGHEDHVGDTLAIAKNNDATVIAVHEICNMLSEQGIEKLEPGNPGGRITTPFGFVSFTPAFHSSSYQGQYMGQPCGLIIKIGDVKIYHAGDTALFSDMKLIGEVAKPNISCIPVGDRFTMGPRLGKLAAEFVGAPLTIPIHYATFDLLTSDISEFTPEGIEVKAMQAGETFTYEG